eukprot:3796249-Pleurochrysis_carterae.AAC.1
MHARTHARVLLREASLVSRRARDWRGRGAWRALGASLPLSRAAMPCALLAFALERAQRGTCCSARTSSRAADSRRSFRTLLRRPRVMGLRLSAARAPLC